MVQESKASEQITPIIGNRGRHRHDVPDSPILEKAQKWMLHHNIEHLHGPEEVDFEEDELVVLVVLRDGRPYIKSFVEHYLSLGAKHLVFLDTGSEDGTIEALRKYENGVTVFRTGLPFKNYQISMRQYLVERFGKGRWTLSADIDELFEYPYSDVVSLKALLGYLRENRYNAVICHMLDMFPEEISSDTETVISDEPLKKLHRFYDTSGVQAYDYSLFHELMDNEISNEEIEVLMGGVQRRLFKISPLLTKHSLVFLEEGVRPIDLSEHWVGGARLADFTGLLLHYKLSASLYGLVLREIEKRTYPNRHGKYDKYLQVLESATQLVMKDETSRELKNVNELVGSRFMTVSKEYMEFVREEDRKRGNPPAANFDRLFEAFSSARSEARAQQAQMNVRRVRQRIEEEAEVRVQRAENQAKWVQQQARNAQEQAQKARQHAERTQQQLIAVRSSRTWKTLEMIGRAKTAVLGTIFVLRDRLAHRQATSNGSESTQNDQKVGIKDSGIISDIRARLKTTPARGPVLKTQTPQPLAQEVAPQAFIHTQEPQISNAKPELSTPPFFIVGSGKSGTTWLKSLLNSHPEILCMGEGRFFNRQWNREDLRDANAKVPPRSLYGALYNSEDLRLWLERSPWSSYEDTERYFASLTRFTIEYFLQRKLVSAGGRVVGDKTPFFPGANVVEEIKEIYPEAKIIHVIRDGRDVEVSWIHHRWRRALDRGGVQVLRPGEIERREAYENDPQRLAELGVFEERELRRRAGLWREQVSDASESGPRLMGNNYTEVRYESLLDDTAAETERLLTFLGVESGREVALRCVEDASFENLSGGRQRGEEDNSSFFRKGIAGDWRNVFTEKDKQVYKEAAGDLLIQFGYEKDNDW